MSMGDSRNRAAGGEQADFLGLPGVRPIRELLVDAAVTEIMINGPNRVFVERRGRMQPVGIRFENEQQLRLLVEAIVRPSGRSVDVQNPYVDCRLPDGSRVNVILPPLAIDGPTITIRKFTRNLKAVEDLVQLGTMSPAMATFLCGAIRGRANIVFAGATGTGKTTTLGILSKSIPEDERIVVIEDTTELELSQPNVVRLECRRANVEGKGEVTSEHLLRNTLRMRPTRIVVGEIRGSEAVEMLQAIASGHEGCLAVLHASSPTDAVARLEMMTLSRGLHLPLWAIHRQIADALDLIVQHELLSDGTRKVTRVTEVSGVDGDRVQLHDLFRFDNEGPNETGKVLGRWVCTGKVPDFLPKFERRGVRLATELFAGETTSSPHYS